jgi:hypothetical protein
MIRKLMFATVFLALGAVCAHAADITGKWNATVSANGGTYVFDLHQDGTALTGQAIGSKGGVAITDGKVEGNTVTFTETLDMSGKPLAITYTGTIEGDTIKFTRMVGESIKEDFVATKAK